MPKERPVLRRWRRRQSGYPVRLRRGGRESILNAVTICGNLYDGPPSPSRAAIPKRRARRPIVRVSSHLAKVLPKPQFVTACGIARQPPRSLPAGRRLDAPSPRKVQRTLHYSAESSDCHGFWGSNLAPPPDPGSQAPAWEPAGPAASRKASPTMRAPARCSEQRVEARTRRQ